MAKKKSQTELVWDYMKANGGITTLQAYDDLGITRLSARIWELRHQHQLPIDDEDIEVPRRNGETTQVKRYFFVPRKQLALELS